MNQSLRVPHPTVINTTAASYPALRDAKNILPQDLFFVGYRSSDAYTHARYLAALLGKCVGEDRVFVDQRRMGAGQHIRHVLVRNIPQFKVMVVVIGQGWLSAVDELGRRRLDLLDDYVRMEIIWGLASENTVVVPFLVDGARMPRADELPEDLRPLASLNYLEADNTSFEAKADELVSTYAAAASGGIGSPSRNVSSANAIAAASQQQDRPRSSFSTPQEACSLLVSLVIHLVLAVLGVAALEQVAYDRLDLPDAMRPIISSLAICSVACPALVWSWSRPRLGLRLGSALVVAAGFTLASIFAGWSLSGVMEGAASYLYAGLPGAAVGAAVLCAAWLRSHDQALLQA